MVISLQRSGRIHDGNEVKSMPIDIRLLEKYRRANDASVVESKSFLVLVNGERFTADRETNMRYGYASSNEILKEGFE